ncbi:MAG: MBL fold metallo-hydrolase [Saprospiraceae bacterium]|nr:MBL fold metallo-hydrolase [Saprospiraceae bacterium]
MTQIQAFEFNPFAENTYVVWDETRECVIFDPGCYFKEEEVLLRNFIEEHQLKPVRLINTHCHLDHVFGNQFVSKTWGLDLEIHEGELPVLERFTVVCQTYNIPINAPQPAATRFLNEGQWVEFGHSRLEVLFTPGHSPASISFYCKESGFLVAGDVLFLESIGRTDLPGGDFDTLINSIRTKLFVLPGETLVYPGHGPATTIRHEMEYNPFL